jgi:hypothetical protein
MEVTRDLLKNLRSEIDAALLAVAKKNGLKSLTAGSATFGSGQFTFKLEGIVAGGQSKEADRYTSSSASFLGLPKLGSEFKSGGHMYKTAGLNSTGSKVLCDRDDGKVFLFPVDTCKTLIAARTAAAIGLSNLQKHTK